MAVMDGTYRAISVYKYDRDCVMLSVAVCNSSTNEVIAQSLIPVTEAEAVSLRNSITSALGR